MSAPSSSTSASLAPGDHHPFWNYEEVALFIGAILPAVLLSALTLSAGRAIAPGLFESEAVQNLVFQLLIYAILLGTIHLMFHLRHERPMWSSLGWTLHFRGAWVYLITAPFLAIGISILGSLINAPILPSPVETLANGGASIAAIAIFAVVVGPLFEELVFRGFLFPLLRHSFGALAGIGATAMLFALIHGQQYEWSWKILLLLLIAGVVFGAIRHRTGSTAASTLMHAGYNLTLFVFDQLQG